MASKNPFEDFINEELEKMDEFSGESPFIEQYPVKIEVAVDYIFEPQTKRLISLMYEPRYSKRLDNIRSGNTNTFVGRFDYFKFVWKRKCYSREEAIDLEAQIKDMSHSEKWNLVKGM